mgnify:CR=1 FL=1
MKKSIIVGTKTIKYSIKTSRVPRFTNQNQRRNFTSRFKRKVKNGIDELSRLEEEPQEQEQLQVPDTITNHINQTTVFHIFRDILAPVPHKPLIVRSKRKIDIGAKYILEFNDEVQYILTHSIN